MSLKRNNQVDFTVLLIVLPLIFLLIGVVFLSVAIGVGVYDRNKQDRCSETTQAQVVDIAVNRDARGALCGDTVYDQVLQKAACLTPVPGGVGPVTRAILMENTLKAAAGHDRK